MYALLSIRTGLYGANNYEIKTEMTVLFIIMYITTSLYYCNEQPNKSDKTPF